MTDMPLRRGVHARLEQAADDLIFAQTRKTTSHADKSDVLTPWKEVDRRRREVYTTEGTPDGALRQGIFGRVLNPEAPHLNSVQAMKPPKQGRTNAWDKE